MYKRITFQKILYFQWVKRFFVPPNIYVDVWHFCYYMRYYNCPKEQNKKTTGNNRLFLKVETQGTKVHSIQLNNMSLPSIRREGAYKVKNTYWQVGELGNKNIHFSAVLGLVYPCTRYEPWSSRLPGGLLMSYYSSWPVGIIASYKRNVQQVIPVSMWVGTVKAAGLEKMHNS